MPDRRPPTDAELERMLDGGPLPPALAALRAPAQPAELRGEEAALAAFRAARAPAPVARRRARLVGRALVVKVAVAGAVLAGGGLAVAAATGTLPTPSSTRPPTTDHQAPGRPGTVVHQDRPTRAPHPPAPPVTSRPPGPPGPSTSPGAIPGDGNAWGHGHGTGKPSKPPKSPKPSKKPHAPNDKATPPKHP